MNAFLMGAALVLAQSPTVEQRLEQLEKENAALRARLVLLELESKMDPLPEAPSPKKPPPKPVKEKRRIPSPRIDMAAYMAEQGGGGWNPGQPFTWGPRIGGCRGRER